MGLLTAELINDRSSNGPFNPTIAMQAFIWGKGIYKDEYHFNSYARYAWAYMLAPFISGILAAIGVKVYMNQDEPIEGLDEAKKVFSEM